MSRKDELKALLEEENARDASFREWIGGKLIRDGHGISWLAELLGVSISTAYRRFKNPSDLTVGELRMIARHFNLTAEEVAMIGGARI